MAIFPSSLRLVPFDLENNRDLFLRCYADTWQIAHGSLSGFDEESIYRASLIRASTSPKALNGLWEADRLVGLLALDERRGGHQKLLWISFFYIMPELRGQGYGRALMGYAEELARELGRNELQLCTARTNPSLQFYAALDFRVCGTEPGATEPLLKLRKPIEISL